MVTYLRSLTPDQLALERQRAYTMEALRRSSSRDDVTSTLERHHQETMDRLDAIDAELW